MENPPVPSPRDLDSTVASPALRPSLLELAGLFAFIGLTSFGGGLTAYIRRLVVTQKRWLTDEEFLPGLALVQLLPGANVAGLSIYIGNHLKGPFGAVIALGAILSAPFAIVCALGFLYFHAGATKHATAVLAGVTAAACGLMASMVFEAGQKAIRGIFDILLIIVTCALVRVAHLHVPYVIMIVAPVAIWWHRPRPEKTAASIKSEGNSGGTV